jgi:hypothetical protein
MKMPRLTSLLSRGLLLAGLAALGGGCVLSAEGELPDVQVTQHDVAIPAAPKAAAAAAETIPVTVTFSQKPSRAGLNRSAFSQVRVLGVKVSAKSGVPDLSFVTSLRLWATSPEAAEAGLAPVEIGSFERADQGAAGAQLIIDNASPPDVTELWKASELLFTLTARGRMPNVGWTADIGLRFEATLTY